MDPPSTFELTFGGLRAGEWRVEHTRPKVKRLTTRLVKLARNHEISACYEPGPCGWALRRRGDPLTLATYLKADLQNQETVRDIVRQREPAEKDSLRARHRLSKFVIRRHLGFVGKTRWDHAHHQ